MKLKYIKVEPIKKDDVIIGTSYIDQVMDIGNENPLFDLFHQVCENVGEYSSIMLYRRDVRDLADKINVDAFKEIKRHLRSNYSVLKLRYNPRTNVYNGEKTVFIVHKQTENSC